MTVYFSAGLSLMSANKWWPLSGTSPLLLSGPNMEYVFRTLFVRRPESCCWPRPTNYWEQVNRRTWGLLLRLTARRACRYFRRNLVPLYREVKPDASVSINGLCVNEIITLWNWNMMGGFSFESVRETALAFKIVKLAPSVFGLSAS